MSFVDQISGRIARRHVDGVWRRFLAAAQDAPRVQERALLDKLRRNADSGFGHAHGFARIRSYGDFAARVPVLRYDDLAPYVERVKAGEVAALFGGRQRVRMFAISSGTTEQPKFVPVTDAFLREYRWGWHAFGSKALRDHPRAFLRTIVQAASPMDEQRTSTGIPCGAISGMMAATQMRLVRRYYAVPPAVSRIGDTRARHYAIMRFALPADPAFCITASPATQLALARTADRDAEALIRDIRDGTLSTAFDVAPEIRAALRARLRPDPRGAARLEQIARRSGRLLPKDCWRLEFLANWTGGTMGLYLRDFADYFGDVPVRDIGLLASEGRMTIPIADGTPAGALDVVNNFFEFIPTDEYGSSAPTVLRCHELSVGREYYILLTTSAGFYRYDIGDVVRVSDFLGRAPVLEFLHKGAHISSLTGEKLTERQVVLAFERACRALGVCASCFVLAPQWADPPYYRLHMEETPECSCEMLAARFDQELQSVNVEYASKRSSDRLGPIAPRRLPPGTLRDHDATLASRHRKANEQFKHRYLYTGLGEDAELLRVCAGREPAHRLATAGHPPEQTRGAVA